MGPRFDRTVGLNREMSYLFAAAFAVMVFLSCLSSLAQAQSDDEPAAAISSALSGSDAAADSSDAPADSDAVADYAPPDDSADAADGQVLELPQQIDPATLQDASGATDSGSNPTQDRLGSIADYQDQSGADGLGVLPGAEPASPGMFAVPRVAGLPVVVQGGPAMVPMLPLIVRPGGLGTFPATSPMLFPPRGSRAIPGGWWTRTHR